MSDVIETIVTNRTTRFRKPYPRKLIDELTSYALPGVWHMPAYHRFREVVKIVDGKKRVVQERIWDGKRHLLDKETNTLPTGLYFAIKQQLNGDYKFHDISQQVFTSKWYSAYTGDLEAFLLRRFPQARRYQIDAAIAMIQASNCGGLILQATGSGKTYLAGMVFNILFDAKCLFVVDELTLLHQAKEELEKVAGEQVGIVGESKYETQRITVATIQTLWLHRRDALFKQWLEANDLLVIDEIHVQMARRNFDIVEKLQPKAVYGLTATLSLKHKHVRLRAHALCGPVLYEYPIREGVRDRVLSKVCVVRVFFDKPAKIRRGKGAYLAEYKKHVTHSKSRNDLVEQLVRVCVADGRKVILLVEQVNHLQRFGNRLHDLKPKLVWGGKKSEERLQALHDFDSGKLKLVIANKVFEKGVNVKAVDTGINAAAMKSENKAMQALGRFVRVFSGKRYAVYFDIADRGNRFEKAARRRYKTFKYNAIPVVRVLAPVERYAEWYKKVMAKVEKVLEIEKVEAA